MLRGLYSAAAGMVTQQRRHDTVTNNIANLNTPGYKQVQTAARSFPEMLLSRMGHDPSDTPIGSLAMGVLPEENIPVFMQGDLAETRMPGDLAILSNIQVPGVVFDESGRAIGADGEVFYQPQAFFTVQTEAGETRYTRGGRFTQNEQGELTTLSGQRVLAANGLPIRLDVPLTDAALTAGGIWTDARTGAPLTDAAGQSVRLMLARIDNPNELIREGEGLFRLHGDQAAAAVGPGDQVEVRQGFYERSNVDPASSMVDLMAALRAYEANQKIVQFYDRSLDKAVNEVGKV